eukprot:7265707-Prymnesium_polylepis.1
MDCTHERMFDAAVVLARTSSSNPPDRPCFFGSLDWRSSASMCSTRSQAGARAQERGGGAE